MFRLLSVSTVLFLCALCSNAQTPIFTTICAVWKDPDAFAGKIVKIRATVSTGFENSSIVEPDRACDRGMWFSYAKEKDEDSTELDGRDAEMQRKQPVFLLKNDGYKKFDEALEARVYPRKENSICMDCGLYTVTATMTGRVDYAGKDKYGFGHMNMARLRFVMASVSDVSTVEKQYDWDQWSRTPIRFPHGTVQGTVTDATGKGVRFAEVEAVPVEGPIPNSNPEVMTEDDGRYSFDLPPGRYLLVVNRWLPATTSVPMNATYYPSAERREQAQMVVVTDGVTLPEHNIRPLHSLVEKHLRVHVIWPDGTPVNEANVNVAEDMNPYAIAGADDGGVRHTGKDGWAALLAYQGKNYRLYADIYKKPGYVPYCENVFSLPADFRNGLEVTMVLRRQDESCRGQWSETPRPLPSSAVTP